MKRTNKNTRSKSSGWNDFRKRRENEPLIIPRSEKNGGPLHISPSNPNETRWDALKRCFADGSLHPGDLKPAVEQHLSVGTAHSLASRLARCIPSWTELDSQLDLAFPPITAGGSGKQKPKSKKTPDSRTGDSQAGQPVVKDLGSTKNKPSGSDQLDPNRLDVRVGRIVSANKHPNADSLYVEEVDFGPSIGRRTVVSGLANYYPLDKLQNMLAVFLVNLKPVKMRGIESQAMLLCASHKVTDGTDIVRPLQVDPNTFQLGERLVFHPPELVNDFNPTEPDKLLNPKTKLWEQLSPDLTVATPERWVQWKSWRLGSLSASHWIFGSSDVPVGTPVR